MLHLARIGFDRGLESLESRQLMVSNLFIPPANVFPPADPPYYRVRYEPSKQPGELIFGVNYTVWVPPGVKTLRGVIASLVKPPRPRRAPETPTLFDSGPEIG